MREGLVDLQGPHALVVDPVGGDAALLAEGPQPDGPVRAARQTLEEEVQGQIPLSRLADTFSPPSPTVTHK